MKESMITRRGLLLGAPAAAAVSFARPAAPAAAETGTPEPRGRGRRPAFPRGALSVRGADISFTLQEYEAGNSFRDHGRPRPLSRLLAAHGMNFARFRLWVNPPPGYSDLETTLRMARHAHAAGLRLHLDLHYSDFWADPSKQPTPAAWQGQDLPTLARTVHRYTRDVVEAFARQGTPLDMVQIGNEITAGMLWPLGQIYATSTPNFADFARLVNAGIAGARAGQPRHRHLWVMLHIDRGGDNAGSRYFFDHVIDAGVTDFDVIGESYYPFWHGPMSALRANLTDLAPRYDRALVVVETAYPWTLRDGDALANSVTSAAQLPDGDDYPATPRGQAAYFEALRQVLTDVPDRRGAGFFDWEPEWIPGVGWEPGSGNPNDNLTMFDFRGNALPSLAAFRPPHGPGRR